MLASPHSAHAPRLGSAETSIRFLAIAFTALALVPGGAHLLELPNKLGLSADQYLVVQRLYRGWALVGVLVVGALISTAALAYTLRGKSGFVAALAALLRLSKQGGEHWILDGTVAAHSRKLDFNDLGYMDRQNVLRGGAYVEYRTLDPWAFLLETHSSLLAYAENNLDGLSLGRGFMFLENVVLDGYWTVTLGAYGSAARFDDREVGDGTALERAGMLGAVQSISTDPRQALVLSGEVAEERLDNGANVYAELALLWHPASMLELQSVASYTYNYGEPRFTGPGASPEDLLFGRLYAQSAGLLVRAAYTFMPALTLQAFAQAFLASGEYFDYARYSRVPGTPLPVIHLSELQPVEPPAALPDFEHASLAINVVLRWEYALGSTLYFVYLRSQVPDIVVDPAYLPRLNLGALRSAPATDVFLIKLAYWIG